MSWGRIRTAAFTLVFLASAVLLSVAADSKPGFGDSFRPPPGALVAPGKAASAMLLYTGDVLGFVDPCG